MGAHKGHKPTNTKPNTGSWKKGRTPWNKGLTINDPRVKQYSQKRVGQKHTEKTKNIIREKRLQQKAVKTSKAELIFKKWLENSGVNFIHQWRYKLGIADFYLPDIKLVIECDGKYWHSKPDYTERDKKKREYLKSIGIDVVPLQSEIIVENGGNIL